MHSVLPQAKFSISIKFLPPIYNFPFSHSSSSCLSRSVCLPISSARPLSSFCHPISVGVGHFSPRGSFLSQMTVVSSPPASCQQQLGWSEQLFVFLHVNIHYRVAERKSETVRDENIHSKLLKHPKQVRFQQQQQSTCTPTLSISFQAASTISRYSETMPSEVFYQLNMIVEEWQDSAMCVEHWKILTQVYRYPTSPQSLT